MPKVKYRVTGVKDEKINSGKDIRTKIMATIDTTSAPCKQCKKKLRRQGSSRCEECTKKHKQEVFVQGRVDRKIEEQIKK